MIHRGEIVKKILLDRGFTLKSLSKKLGYKSERYIYNLLNRDDLPWETIKKIGLIINYDFTNDFKEIANIVEEPIEPYGVKVFSIEEEMIKWKDKYFSLLEKYTEMLEGKKNELAVLQSFDNFTTANT